MCLHTCRQVTVEATGSEKMIVDEADVVISARDTLNDISWPDVPGLTEMTIPVMHSAAWDDRYVNSILKVFVFQSY